MAVSAGSNNRLHQAAPICRHLRISLSKSRGLPPDICQFPPRKSLPPPPLGEGRDLGACGVGDDSADALGRCAQGVIEKVRVSACCLRLRMAKQTANYVQAHTRTGQLGGETVP